MKSVVYIKQHDDTEEVVYVSEPIDMSNNDITDQDIFEKIQQQQSRMLKDRALAYMELLLKG